MKISRSSIYLNWENRLGITFEKKKMEIFRVKFYRVIKSSDGYYSDLCFLLVCEYSAELFGFVYILVNQKSSLRQSPLNI